jgi:hypothetical protein
VFGHRTTGRPITTTTAPPPVLSLPPPPSHLHLTKLTLRFTLDPEEEEEEEEEDDSGHNRDYQDVL